MKRRSFALTLFFLILFFATQVSSQDIRSRAEKDHDACLKNLKNLGTALAMYSTDHKGHFPPTRNGLQKLTPLYLKTLPKCPAAGRMTYRYYNESHELNTVGYQDYYYLACEGGNHESVGIIGNFPGYCSINGLVRDWRAYKTMKGR